MIDYKKIIKSRELRVKILDLFSFVPDELMLRLQYLIKTGRKLHLKNPKRFTEKLQWYKLFYRNPLMPKCVDKYNVREYVKSKGLECILVKNYGIYSDVESINWFSLPNRFVIKSTNGNNVIIVKDKKIFDLEKNIPTFKSWFTKHKNNPDGREWAYYGLKTRLVVDQYLENIDNPHSEISDYKFFCFNGKVEYIVMDIDRYTNHKRNFYDSSWHYKHIITDHDTYGDTVDKPILLNKMKEIAEMLSHDFPFVRVDLYCVGSKIYFGELTFYPWSGYTFFNPDNFDFELGSKFILPNKVLNGIN